MPGIGKQKLLPKHLSNRESRSRGGASRYPPASLSEADMIRQKKEKNLNSNKMEDKGGYMTESHTLESLETEIDKSRFELEKIKKEIAEKSQILTKNHEDDTQEAYENPISISVSKAELKKKIEKQKAYDSVMVTGRFMNQRAPGKAEKLLYMKYEDCPVKWYEFEHNKVYTIPRGFADQINDHYYTPHFIQKEGGIVDPNKPGSQIAQVDTSNKKYAFVPVNF